MKTKNAIILIAVLAIIGAGICLIYFYSWTETNPPVYVGDGNTQSDIIVTYPSARAEVLNDFIVKGRARGTWYFEASFPVKILDADGNLVVQSYATAQGDWMTEDFVPFEAHLVFNNPQSETGFLVLEKDNPSGLPENEAEIRIPITFSKPQ